MPSAEQSSPAGEIPLEELSYEQALQELESIVAALEQNERPLDESLRLYERGQALARYCAELLDQADLQVQQLSGEELAEFDSADPAGG